MAFGRVVGIDSNPIHPTEVGASTGTTEVVPFTKPAHILRPVLSFAMGFLDRLKDAMTSPAAKAENWAGVTAKRHEWSYFEESNWWVLDFCYSYQFEGEFYSGQRQWRVSSPLDAERMGAALEPLEVFQVRVNPQDPEKSWLADEEIVAHGVDLAVFK